MILNFELLNCLFPVPFFAEFYDARMELNVIESLGRGYLDRRVSKVCFDLIIEHLRSTENVWSHYSGFLCWSPGEHSALGGMETVGAKAKPIRGLT